MKKKLHLQSQDVQGNGNTSKIFYDDHGDDMISPLKKKAGF